MSNNTIINKETLKDVHILSEDEIKKLNFHELCLYLKELENMEEILKGSES